MRRLAIGGELRKKTCSVFAMRENKQEKCHKQTRASQAVEEVSCVAIF